MSVLVEDVAEEVVEDVENYVDLDLRQLHLLFVLLVDVVAYSAIRVVGSL